MQSMKMLFTLCKTANDGFFFYPQKHIICNRSYSTQLYLLFTYLNKAGRCSKRKIVNTYKIRPSKIQYNSVLPTYPNVANTRKKPR